MKCTTVLAILLAALLVLLPNAAAQPCPGGWIDGPDQGAPGIVGIVYSTCEWDPDGDGPLPPLLVVGGLFTVAGHVFADNIAAWDGASWRPLGSGIGGTVFALTQFNGELVAAGQFTSAGGVAVANIARWDGASWHPLGSGLTAGGLTAQVAALTVFRGELIAGGSFTVGGGTPASRIARWNGSAWQGLGAGMSAGNQGNPSVFVLALTLYQGDLIAAGAFNFAGAASAHSVARWNGLTWQAVGYELYAGTVRAVVEYGGELIAGGDFFPIGGSGFIGLAHFDGGVWRPLHSNQIDSVSALAVYNGRLYAGGYVNTPGVPFSSVARLGVDSWEVVGQGNPSGVRALLSYNGGLIAAGGLVTRWDDATWRTIGSGFDGAVAALATFNGNLIAGGIFSTAGDVWANSIVSWDGRRWSPLGSGMTGPSPTVSAMLTYHGDLIAAGYFDTAGGANARCVARWDGGAWHAMGSPTFLDIHAIVEFRGQLIAAGRVLGGTIAINHVTMWDGEQWRPFDHDLDGWVRSLLIYRGDLYAAGEFAAPDGSDRIPRPRVARWDGHGWSAVGDRLAPSGEAQVLALYQGDLILGGTFGVVRWNNHAWTSIGSGLDFEVYALATFGNDLIAGGSYSPPDGLRDIARWNGDSWLPMQGGTTYTPSYGSAVFALHEFRGQLVAGGGFRGMGGRVSVNWARWGRGSCDFDNDGVEGTDQDIGLFLRCLAGDCCPACGSADFDGDGDVGADADIEAFFRVLAGGPC